MKRKIIILFLKLQEEYKLGNNTLDLKGKTAVITGAGNGIGKAAALILAQHGANVVCGDLHKETAEKTAEEARKFGVKAIGVACDVTNEKDLENLAAEAVKNMEGINILVNNAGGGGGGREKFDTLTLDYIEKIYRLNVFSIYKLSQLCIPYMNKDKYGSIINISSMAGQMTSHNMSVYGSSKAAINQLTKYMAVDLGPYIRVNAIAPGAIKTDALKSVLTDEMEKKMLVNTPLKVLGETEDIANTILYFASPMSKWVSGQVIAVNGGGTQSLE